MIVAETVQIDGGTVALFLAALLLFVLAVIAIIVGGCVFARRAARGSTPALVGWLTITAFELVITGLAAGRKFFEVTLGLLALVAFQASFYVVARRKRP